MNMYEKITLCVLVLLVIARSEEVSTVKNVKAADFLNSRLTTILPYLSLYDDKHLIKDNPKRSLVLLMPRSQTRYEHEKPKETIQKTKRCGQSRKNKFLLLSTKENTNRPRTRSTDKNINVGISKQNSNDDALIKKSKYSEENSATSNRMEAETHEDKTLLRVLKDNLNAEDVIVKLKSQEKAKKCNTEKYICHCKEEDCFSSSSKKSSSRMLDSPRIDAPERINHRRLTRPEILQQKSPKLYHESSHELRVPSLINYFAVQPYQEKLNNIPRLPILYEITPNVSPHIVGNEREYVNVGIPFTSLEGRPNYPVESNPYDQYSSIIRQKPCICSPITGEHQIGNPVVSTTSPSTNYVVATTIRETENNLESNNLVGVIGENQKHFATLTTEIPNVGVSETETNFDTNYSTDVTEESSTENSFNLNGTVYKSEDFTEKTENDQDSNLSKVMTSLTDYVSTSSVPSIVYPLTNDGKFINMKECIQLFGRDVCVLSATSPGMLAKQAQENNPNKYSTIRIPEYVSQTSTIRQETTLNNINYSNKLKTTDPYFASESSTNGIKKSNNNLHEYLESTSTKSNVDVDENSLRESIEQIYKPTISYDENKSFSTVENTPIKKLMDQTTDEAVKTERNKLLGKSKSHATKLLLNPNDEETNPTSSDKSFNSTFSYKSNSDEEMNNLKVDPQNRVINTNYNSNIPPKEETTVSYDSKTGYNSTEKNRNYLKESNTNVYSEKKIPQEHFKEETTTISSDSKTGYNFEEEIRDDLIGTEASIYPGDIRQEQSTTIQYFDDKSSSDTNNKDTIGNHEAIVDSSINRLPFCDNTLLLNSIRKVINDFASDARLSKTKDLDENILQTQGKNLLPEILQVPNLRNILLMPQIENTIIEKVKDALSYVTAIPRKDFTNDWSHGVIRNTLHSILEALSGFHHKLPPMTVEEHQFKDGQWKTNLVTLAPVSDQKLSIAAPENLRESIKDLLSSPAIASQIDQYIVRNMIVQSVKNSLNNDEDEKIDDIIIHALNDVLQISKDSEDIDALRKSNKFVSDEKDMDVATSQEIPTDDYETEININNSILNGKQNFDIKENTEIDSKKMQITDDQKAKTLENKVNILIASESPHLSQLREEEEKETSSKATAKIKENIGDQSLDEIKKIDVQDDAEKKLAKPVEPKITYHKAVLQNNPNILATFEPNSTRADEYIKNHRVDDESAKITTTTTNFTQETSPNYVRVSDSIILENTVGAKDIEEEIERTLNEKTLTTLADEINPVIILERIKSNLPPIKYYSPEIVKYVTNPFDDKNVEVTTAATNFIQEASSNYAQLSDSIISQNITETRDVGDKMDMTTTAGSQQQNFIEGNIIKIHEVTTDIQRTYAKTTYFKAAGSSDDSPRINTSSLTYETANTHINNNNSENKDSNNGNNNLIGNKMNNTDDSTKTKEINKEEIVSSSNSSAADDNYSLQLFPSSTTSDDISELQRSQLYYINGDVKLPLEIRKLKDGSYALLISKNICEQILNRKCPCCVPLQGHVVRALKNHQQEDMHTMTSTTMGKKDQENVYVNEIRSGLKTQRLEEEEEERMSVHNLRKRNMNNNNLATISMPVIDFAKKYNLLLDFNEEGILFNGTGLQNKTQNYDKSSMKSVEEFEHDQSEKRNSNNYIDIKKNELLGENNDAVDRFQNNREKKNTPSTSFPLFPITQKFFNLGRNSIELALRKTNAKMNQSEVDHESKLGLSDIAEGNTKVFYEKEDKERDTMKLVDNKRNVPEIKENIGRPYRYQRNANDIVNKRTELVKSMLHWLKGLFVDK